MIIDRSAFRNILSFFILNPSLSDKVLSKLMEDQNITNEIDYIDNWLLVNYLNLFLEGLIIPLVGLAGVLGNFTLLKIHCKMFQSLLSVIKFLNLT